MKKIATKMLIIILILLILNNFFIGACYANDYAIETADDIVDVLTGCVGVLVAILTLPLRIVAILAGYAINALTSVIAYVDGATTGNSKHIYITPYDIFFNKARLFEINFFDIPNDGSIASEIRASVAGWYYVMRTLAAAILLVILIYVGIRMAISTVASDRAMFKRMLVDWISSLALIFVLQYIIIFTISANDAIVKAISLVVDSEGISKVYSNIVSLAIPWPISIKNLKSIISLDSLAATAIYCMLVWQTLGLVFSYFNRMLKLAFLIIISPLISLTYSIDKMGDGKAQALGTWLKEFVFTILIQPFHCVIYMCFIDAAFDILVQKSGMGGATDGGGTLAASLIAILCIKFIKEGEKIVRKIFAFKDDNSTTSLAAGMAASAIALSKAKSIGKTARNTVNGAKNFVKGIAPGAKNIIAEAGAAALVITNIGKSDDGNDGSNKKTTFAERKEKINNKLDDASSAWREKVYSIRPNKEVRELINKEGLSKAKALEKVRENRINAEKKKLISQDPTLSEERANAMARLNVAKKDSPVKRGIKGVKKGIKRINPNLETTKVIADLTKKSMTAGVGFMVGSGVYGTSGNLATALTSGAAASSGLSEFMSGSKSTIVSGMKRNLEKLSNVNNGENTTEQALKEIGDISDNREKFDVGEGQKGEEKLKELLKEIVKEAGLDDNEIFSQKIDTTIKRVQQSPLYADSAIENFINDIKTRPDADITGSGFENSRVNLEEFGNRVAISQQIQSSESAGISLDDIKESISDEFIVESSKKTVSSTTQKIVAEVSNSSDIVENLDTLYEEKIKDMKDKDLKDLSKKFDTEIAKLKKLSSDSGNFDEETRKEFEKAKDRVVVQSAFLISKKLLEEETDLSSIGIELGKEYQAKLDEAIEVLQKDKSGKYKEKVKELDKIKTDLVRQKLYKNKTQ